jgi:hypothetical protein
MKQSVCGAASSGPSLPEDCDLAGGVSVGADSSTKYLFGSTEPFIIYGARSIKTVSWLTFWCKQNGIAQLRSASSVI